MILTIFLKIDKSDLTQLIACKKYMILFAKMQEGNWVTNY